MNNTSFESAIFSDRSDTQLLMLIALRSIVTSRKRKLHELYAVATSVEKAPQDASHNIESTQAALSELQFLQANDILL